MSDTTIQYLLDTSVIIEASKRYYHPEIAPNFWDSLAARSKTGLIGSINEVRAEIDPRNEFLTCWAENDFTQLESTDNIDTLDRYRKLIEWSTNQTHFDVKAKAKFASKNIADAWLVAHAMVIGCTVVTEEVFNDQIKRSIPIPNACKAFGVKCLNTFEMLREIGITL